MSKLKITIEPKEVAVPECKHEVGGVYKQEDDYYMLVYYSQMYRFLCLSDMVIMSAIYKSLVLVDFDYPNDIPVDAELIIREVK